MKLNLWLHPEPTTGGMTVTATVAEHIHHTQILPTKDNDLKTVSKAVSDKWLASPQITLVWMTAADFATLAGDFKLELTSRQGTGAGRSPVTDQLETLDGQIDDAAREVKAYIADKFGATHATANYPPFGYIHRHRSYELPRDHDRRRDALAMMVAAIAANGLGAKPFGTAFWTAAQTQFNTLLSQANTTDGSVSTEVSTLNVLRTQVRNVLHAILLLLQANYPDTYRGVRREWGFQKEDY